MSVPLLLSQYSFYNLHCRESPSMLQWLSRLPLNPRFAGSNPAENDGFLRAIKVRSMTSFGGEVKPAVPNWI
jgi:hypothetical protein